MGNSLLDIEFAFDKKGQLYIFQVRPIVSSEATENYGKFGINKLVLEKYAEMSNFFKNKEKIAGSSNILGRMPDWNPAELIGERPKPLSLSIFNELITRKTWRLARSNIGYFNTPNEELLIVILGLPEVIVQCSDL